MFLGIELESVYVCSGKIKKGLGVKKTVKGGGEERRNKGIEEIRNLFWKVKRDGGRKISESNDPLPRPIIIITHTHKTHQFSKKIIYEGVPYLILQSRMKQEKKFYFFD